MSVFWIIPSAELGDVRTAWVMMVMSGEWNLDKLTQAQCSQEKLSELISDAKKNEALFKKFHQLELGLVSTNSLPELIDYIANEVRSSLDLDVVTLALFDPESVVKSILIEEDTTLENIGSLVLIEDYSELSALYGKDTTPQFGSLYSHDFHLLFSKLKRCHGSVILLPIMRNGYIIGSLNIGSYNPRRFVSGLGTEFLERFVSILAICIENAINLGKLRRMSLTDSLTDTYNRRAFEQRLLEELARAHREHLPVSALLVDIDFFKKINDKYGHDIGDLVLKHTAAVIKDCLRQSDLLARVGGEEFACLLPNANAIDAAKIAERIRRAVESNEINYSGQKKLSVTISCGCSFIDGKELLVEQLDKNAQLLFKQADSALYKAKQSQRNIVKVYRARQTKKSQAALN